jgi:alkylation response protein AidB-like acyl-CoA dehydrogenase
MSLPSGCWDCLVGDELDALRDAVRAFLAQHGTSARVRATIADAAPFDAATWKRLTGELGLAGLAVPESSGGAGASLAEVAVVVSELGRALLPSPYLSTAVAGAVLSLAGETEVLPGVAAGSTIVALAVSGDSVSFSGDVVIGTASFVVDGPSASVFLVRAGDELVLVRADDADVAAVPALDQTRSLATVKFEAAPALVLSADRPLGPFAEDLMRALLAVECVGAAERALELTIEYLKTREQFGKPIGSFQALKHRCADLAVALAAARSLAGAAVAAVSGDDFAVLAPAAKLLCSQTFTRVAGEMIQLHGGIGFTWEHDAHLFFKRAKSNDLLFGAPSELRRLVGRRAGLLGGL